VKHIQAALLENRFRLVQQPITNLGGGVPMFDLLIRMLDRSRREILPNEFLPAAERNELMAPIDRWVISAAARFAAESKPGCLFVRLSRQSAIDDELPRWLGAQLAAGQLDPKQLCLTVTEAVAFFADQPEVLARLKPLADVGLSYLRLGQPVPTLSGGEAQRLKLAGHLADTEAAKRQLLIFDEPTTGLHFEDIAQLMRAFRQLTTRGHSLLVIEHNLDVVGAADC
jgi:hypothetical protein